jgi:prepilin-type N-terminal cleavage/methylation domain-containing protein
MAAVRRKYFLGRNGFTLIEIIVAIIVSSILAVVLVQIVGGQTLRSFWPLQKLDEKLILQEVMNTISADYRNLLMTSPAPLETLQDNIGSGSYWSGQPFSSRVSITAVSSCIFIDPSTRVENPAMAHADCQADDRLLKVTIQVQGQGHRLTALFTR